MRARCVYRRCPLPFLLHLDLTRFLRRSGGGLFNDEEVIQRCGDFTWLGNADLHIVLLQDVSKLPDGNYSIQGVSRD